MATETTIPANVARWTPYRLNVRQFLAMIDADIFPQGAQVELLGGMLVQMMTKGNPHDFASGALGDELRRLIPADWYLREDKSLRLGPRSRPEPDIAIVRGPRLQHTRRTPHARETALVVEVSQTSHAYDRGEKWRAYAAARIPTYWIVHLAKGQVEVYREPAGLGKSAAYKSTEVFGIDASIPVVIDGNEVGRVAVRDFLP